MPNYKRFDKKKIAAAVLTGAASMQILAQDTQLEEVTVTGIQGSIQNSMDEKRNSYQVVDGISAEEAGKFPDSNLAEALQRVPGVAIDRDSGEGRYVSLRGLGPRFSSTTINGREIATAESSRAFSFDSLAAESVRKVNIFKTSSAQQNEGGIGGNIDIETAQPFDFDGAQIAGSFKMIHEENSGESGPQGSMLVSNLFMDGRLGVLAGFNYQERNTTGYELLNDGMWFGDVKIREGRPLGAPSPSVFTGEEYEDVYIHQSLRRGVKEETRERTGANIAVQFQASDDILLTADVLHSKLDVHSVKNNNYQGFWAYSDLVLDENNTAVQATNADGFTGYAFIRNEQYRPEDTNALGLNLDWAISDTLTLNTDISWSQAVRDNKGLDSDQRTNMLYMQGITFDYTSGETPQITNKHPDTETTEANIANLRPRRNGYIGQYIDAQNKQVKLDFTWDADMGALTKVDFGTAFSRRIKTNQDWRTHPDLNTIYQSKGREMRIPEDVVSVVDYGNVMAGENFTTYVINSDAYWDFIEDPASIAQLSGEGTAEAYLALAEEMGGWRPHETNASFEVEEDVLAFYVQALFQGYMNDMPWSVVAGLRHSSTDQTSYGSLLELTDLVPGEEEELLERVYATDSGESYFEENKYGHFLPSLTATLEITDELMLRGAASKTLTRPTLENLAPQLQIGSTNLRSRNASGTNPQLQPYQSTNFDLSLEWYYGERDLVSVAYFHKSVDDFIFSIQSEEIFDLETAPDEWKRFNVTRPRNGETAKLNGLEMNWIHTFDSGFGVQMNATLVDSNAAYGAESAYNPDAENQAFALEGLGDSANLVGFYEKDAYSVRVAYNWRDEFLETQFSNTNEPIYVNEHDQIDVSASYDFNDSVTFFLEGINVTSEESSKRGRYENHFISWSDYGARYSLGVRGTF